MPSTRRQKAKSRKSRELDMLSNYGNMDVMLGERNSNSIERELDSLINVPEGQRDFQPFPNRENSSQKNEIRDIDSRNEPVRESRLIESINTLSGEMNARMSREMEAMMDLMQSQISRAISSSISERIIPEIQNMVENLPLGQHGVESCTSADEDGIRNVWKNANTKLTKKDSRSACDLRDHMDVGPYMVTGATELQQPIPEFLTGRIHSQPDLQRQESTHDTTLDTTLPIAEPAPAEQPQDPINRLADVLVNLQNKPHSMTIRPVTTNPMTFDGKTEKFELFKDLFHAMIKMQPAMTEQMKINHFHSLLRKGALQTFRNINSINRQTLEDVLVIFRRKYVKPESQATAKHTWHRLIFDPNTMKLPDFLEELNQCAEKAFGENGKSMIDSLLYAKLPPKLKRSVKMARLENGTNEEIVAHLERELELNALEESDDLPIATMASSSNKSQNLLSNGIDTNKNNQCSYCKAEDHFWKNYPKLKKKKESEAKDGKRPQRQTYPEWPTCSKTNHPAEKCWRGAGAHLRPKRNRQESSKDTEPSEDEGTRTKNKKSTTSSSSQSNSKKPESKTNFAKTPNL